MSARRSILVATVAAVALLTGCGGDDGASSKADGTPGSTEPPRIVVETADGTFNPGSVYEKAAPGVVTITSIFGGGSGGGILGGGGAGQGSGFVISDEGEILTNAHVITDAQAAGSPEDINAAEEVFVQFADRNEVPAEIVGFDPYADVGLIKVDPEGLDIQPLELGEMGDVAVGSPVAAIGSPFGEEQSLSTGVISATDRSIDSLTRFQIDGAIQTDASINPGNSGGPLLTADAAVIGLNQQINTTSGGNEGVGYAVPIDLARRSLEQLREDGSVEYAFIGVTTISLYPQLAEELDVDADTGALVANVSAGGPADDAGLEGSDQEIEFQGRPVQVGGDVIVAVNGEVIVGENDLARLISRLNPGDEVTLEIIRNGDREEVDVTLGEREDA